MLPPRFEVHWDRNLKWNAGESDLDPDTRLKIEALYAIGESDNDKEAFATLKAVALDRGKHVALRSVALDALSEYKTFDVLPIYLEIARTDTSKRLQEDAITFIGEVSRIRIDRLMHSSICTIPCLLTERNSANQSSIRWRRLEMTRPSTFSQTSPASARTTNYEGKRSISWAISEMTALARPSSTFSRKNSQFWQGRNRIHSQTAPDGFLLPLAYLTTIQPLPSSNTQDQDRTNRAHGANRCRAHSPCKRRRFQRLRRTHPPA